ncbi:DUF6886 family protein [Phenylobacterium sp.]|uniref:DUF6886 family protein n=1 Tax=Phenylobacterium sp. TaxID=1871053 RepID=UPI002730DE4B|nr:DUF6886 family protein [Phenylobacterium sp.]MDP1599103.1 hypothetical protein [Phenylobacterium sp.]MDP3594156.1 hypothetical protein [Phenylobacterium sp.]
MRLFHFSDDPAITRFEPRAVLVPSPRAPGREWLNGPLVWAIDEPRQPMYLFPRDCPRILLWPRPETTQADLDLWWGDSPSRMIAHVEAAWLERLSQAALTRYEFPASAFESLDDAGMWVAREAVSPIAVSEIRDLPGALREAGVELRVMESLTPLREVWSSSLHASGVRLRNAAGWNG